MATRCPPPEGYAHPTGPDDVVIEYTELSGFTTREYAFQQPPMVLISGDGRVFTTGPQIAIYPGPALPNIQVGTITEEAVQQLLSIADDDGLFAEIDYTEESLVADASTATVTINVDGSPGCTRPMPSVWTSRARHRHPSGRRCSSSPRNSRTSPARSAPTNSARPMPSRRTTT